MNKEYFKLDKKTVRSFRVSVIVLDVFAIFLLIMQIMFNHVTYVVHIMLLILNIVVFLLKEKKDS